MCYNRSVITCGLSPVHVDIFLNADWMWGGTSTEVAFLTALVYHCSALWMAATQSNNSAVAAGGDDRPDDVASAPRWHPQWGDRCQELVWIGVDMDESSLRYMLDQCLLTDDEMALGPEGWAEFDDPLPPWQMGDEDEHEDELWDE